MSKNKLTKSQAVSKYIDRVKITKRIAFDHNTLEDIFGNDYPDIGWEDIVNYLDELSEIEEVYFEVYHDMNDEIIYIPEELAELENLKKINFAFQQIEYIPNNIRNLRSLEVFNLAGNMLTKFPEILYNLTNLKRIGLSKNDFSIFDIFYEIIGVKKDFFNENLNKTIDEIYKIIVDFYSNKAKGIEIIEKKWGVTIRKKDYNLYFFFDEQIYEQAAKKNIAVCAEAKKNSGFSKFEIFNEIQTLFTHINSKTKKIGGLFFLTYRLDFYDNYISRSNLLKHYKAGATDIEGYSVYDAILNFGGHELFEKLEKEKKQEIARASDFFDKNKNLKSIEIENFKLFENIKINFTKDVNVVIGKNGYGKTSLLQAIALGLAPIQHNEYEAKDKTYNYKKYINKHIFEKFDSKLEQFSKLTLNWNNFVQSYKIYENNLTFNENSNRLPSNYLILAYGANLFSDEKKSIKKIVSEIVEENANGFSIYSILEDYTEQFYNPLEILQELTDKSSIFYPDKEKKIQEKIKIIIETLNVFLNIQEPEAYKIEINKTDNKIYIKGKYYFTNKKGKWELNELSEGYRKNILLITDILLRILEAKNNLLPDEPIKNIFSKVRGTILIDEYDKHLHATWQRELIFNLKKVFKNLQFIITTHNVFSLQSAEGENALIIYQDNKKIKVSSKKITKGLGIESIYNLYLKGDNSYFGYETQTILNDFKKLLEKQESKELTKQEKKEFKNISKELLTYSERIKGIVNREIRQVERQTGKTIEL